MQAAAQKFVIGEQGEARVKAWLLGLPGVKDVVKETERYEEFDFRVFTQDDKSFTVEVKNDDKRATTGNLFLETVSNLNTGRVTNINCDRLIYVTPGFHDAYSFDFAKFKPWFDEFKGAHPERVRDVRVDQPNRAQGIPYSIAECKALPFCKVVNVPLMEEMAPEPSKPAAEKKHEDKVTCDFETFSEVDVRDVGSWVYSEHPSTEILVLSYKINKQRTKIWYPGIPFPQELIDMVEAGAIFEAHNAQFERAIWINVLIKKMGVDVKMPKRWKDTLAACAYRSLPLGLDEVGPVLHLHTQKDKRGKELLRKLAGPRKPTKKDASTRLWDLELYEALYEYCERDTDTEWELSETIGDLPPPEQRTWVLDQIVNQRGVRVDIEAVIAAKWCVERVNERMTTKLVALTDGMVTSHSEVKKIGEWLATKEFFMPDLTAESVTRAIGKLSKSTDKTSKAVLAVLKIRQQLAKSSVAKLDKFIDCTCKDLRIRGLLQYHGAGTGRWAGRLVQPQNFPRGEEKLFETFSMDEVIAIIKQAHQFGDPDWVEMSTGFETLLVISSALRGMFISEPDSEFCNADFSAIEARVTAWVAGQQWKLDAFEKIDKEGNYQGSDDIYCATATGIFGYVVKKKEHKKERQVGKVCELAFGYQGGVGAWRNFDRKEPGEEGYRPDEEIQKYKVAWREKHPMVVKLWFGLEEACLNAVRYEGKPFSYRGIVYQVVQEKSGKWLTCRLPNGRRLWYFRPEIEKVHTDWGEKDQVSYEGRDNKNGGRWTRILTYGGMLTENVVQAISRDIMVEAMVRVERAGYFIVLTVHDEIMCEVKKEFGQHKTKKNGTVCDPFFDELMSEVPAWCKGLPISVDGWRESRYRK